MSFTLQIKCTFENNQKILTFRILPTKRAWLFVGSMTTPFAEMKYAKNIKDLHNKIVECKFENNNWVFMRERTDKSYPNAYTTAVGEFLCNNAPEYSKLMK